MKRYVLWISLVLLAAVLLAIPAGGLADTAACEHTQTITQVTDPTCTTGGSTVVICGLCGAEVSKTSTDPLGHDYQVQVTREASCDAAGERTYTCSRCGASYTEPIPVKEHTPETIQGKAATCTEAGLTDGSRCTVCGAILTAQSEIPARGHTPETIPGRAATCTEGGLTDGSRCSVCGTILTPQQETGALGHTWDGGTVSKAAGCEEEGVMTYTCTRCGASYMDSIPATGHKAEVIPSVPATCTAGGKTEGSQCSVCGKILSAPADIPAKEHEWGPWKEGTAPTCTEKGKNYSVCAVCGTTRYRDDIEPLGHDWDEGTVTREAGYLNPGERTFRCRRCEETRTEEIPALDAGRSMYSLLRNNGPIPGDPAGKGPDELMITIQPYDAFIGEFEEYGEAAVLRVKAAGGTEPYSYTWYRQRETKAAVQVQEDSKFAGLSIAAESLRSKYDSFTGAWKQEITQLSAKKTSGLTFGMIDLTAVTETAARRRQNLDEEIPYSDTDELYVDLPGSYYVIVTDADGHSVLSETADVDYSLRAKDWSRVVYTSGKDTGTAFVEIIGGRPPYTYQWLEDHGAVFVPIEGADSPTAELTPYDVYDSSVIEEDVGGSEIRGYICQVTDSGTGEFEQSCSVEDIRVYRSEPLRVETEETDIRIKPGEKKEFSYRVYGGFGKVDLIILDSQEMVIDHTELPAETDRTGGYAGLFSTDYYGRYQLIASDETGNTYYIPFIIDEKALQIAQQPVGGELPADGSGVKVRIEMAEGTAPFTYTLQSPYAPSLSVKQESPEFIITDERLYDIYVTDAEGRFAHSDFFQCTGYDAGFSDGCASHVEYITDPDAGVLLSLSPSGSKAPYTVRWSFRPDDGSEAAAALETAGGPSVTAKACGEYIYEIEDRNGQIHDGSIQVLYGGDTPWILASPQDVLLQNNAEDLYEAVFTCDAIGSSGSSDGLDFIWQRGSRWHDIWEDLGGNPEVYEPSGKILRVHAKDDSFAWSYRCKVVDRKTGKDACTEPACLSLAMKVNVIQSGTMLEVHVTDGAPPFSYEAKRYRDGMYPPTVIASDHSRKIEEDYPITKSYRNPPNTSSPDLFIYDIDRWASDWYRSSYAGLKKHYHRYAWTYEITVTDQNGAVETSSVTCEIDKPLEWASWK